jgi:hypothetical protein
MDAKSLVPAEKVSASRQLGRADAARLVRAARRVVVAKGKSLRRFEPKGHAPDEAVDAVLGPTGNLRAPALVIGDTLIVGWNEEAYVEALS